jgi:CheY-like chemotaxis protein
MNATKQICSVLMVDDSEDDRFLMRMAFRNHPRLVIIGEVGDGEEAKAYLSGTGIYQDRRKHPIPDLVLLDLKMPLCNGFEVLAWLQTQSFPDLKVVVLSGSFMEEDIAQALALGADDYQTKTASKQEQSQIVQDLEQLMTGGSQT